MLLILQRNDKNLEEKNLKPIKIQIYLGIFLIYFKEENDVFAMTPFTR